ncbi:MAG: lipoate--protein ligase family protein [Actinomycetota bacterium]|nr:lipoate--protein ligase family protein [Actinomycetota bacterium]
MLSNLQLLGGAWPEEPGVDTAINRLILDRVSADEMPATMRLYVPGREVAFGRRDAVTPQYPAAVAAARATGFGTVERLAGGRAAVFTEHTVAFSLAVPHDEPQSGIRDRFQTMGEIIVAAFSRLEIASTIGEVSGEYCPGEYSINYAGRLKLMGVGQRLARRAAHVGGVIVVRRTDLLLRALIPVYRALSLEWRPGTAGSLGDIQPAISNEDVLTALKTELRSRYQLRRSRITPDLVDQARQIAATYLPTGPAED